MCAMSRVNMFPVPGCKESETASETVFRVPQFLRSQVFITESCCWLTGPFKIAKNGRNSSFLHMARPSHDGRAVAFGGPNAEPPGSGSPFVSSVQPFG